MSVPDDDAARGELRALVGDDGSVELRPMFGTLAALVDGHVFAVVMGERIGVKLGADALAELDAVPGWGVLTMGTRQMTAYRTLPPGMPDGERRTWLAPGARARREPAPLTEG